MSENRLNLSGSANENYPSTLPETSPEQDLPSYDDIAGIPSTPVAPPGGEPVYPGYDPMPPQFPHPGWPQFPPLPFPDPGVPPLLYDSAVRFLNACTNGRSLDVFVDQQPVFSGTTFATVSVYIPITDGFHSIAVKETHGPVLMNQNIGFTAGERMTIVLLDSPQGVCLAKVSDAALIHTPGRSGTFRAANMTYPGSHYDVRMFNNRTVFSDLSFKEVSPLKQAGAGNYTFFLTDSGRGSGSSGDIPVILPMPRYRGNCPVCTVRNPIMTFNVRIAPGKSVTSYIIGNPWSNLFRVFTLDD